MDWCTTIRSDITYAWTRAGVVVCIGWAAKQKQLASHEIPQARQFPAFSQGAARQPVLHKTAKIVGLTGAAICMQIRVLQFACRLECKDLVWTRADVPNIATTFPRLLHRKPKIYNKKTTIANNNVNGPPFTTKCCAAMVGHAGFQDGHLQQLREIQYQELQRELDYTWWRCCTTTVGNQKGTLLN